MKKIIFLLVLYTIIISGCQNGGCIKVGGTYGEYTGDVQDCFDSQESNTAGVPVFSVTKEGESQEIYGLPLDKIKYVVNQLRGKLGISALEEGEKKHPVQELFDLLDVAKAREED